MIDLDITSGFKSFPIKGNDFFNKHGLLWIKSMREQTNIFPYWRIHDKLYDLTPFMEKHPGGKFWIKITQGLDVTEVFESYHLSELPREMTHKYYIKDANTPRISPFTFKHDGFFMTLKRKIAPLMKTFKNGPTREMLIIQDSLFLSFFLLMVLAAYYESSVIMIITGLILCSTTISAHNFFHQRDNWRMYMFDFGLLSGQEWRITHGISHHMFPNTVYDFEIWGLIPFIQFLPHRDKNRLLGFLSSTPLNVAYFLGFPVDYAKRWYLYLSNQIEFDVTFATHPVEVVLLSFITSSFLSGLKMWFILQMSFTFFYITIGLAAGHHSKNSFIETDKYIPDHDWGLLQVAATYCVHDTWGESGIGLLKDVTTFGNHTLHHLFPTIDHSKLHLLMPALLETYKEFGIKDTIKCNEYLSSGFHWRLTNNKANEIYLHKFEDMTKLK